jgi:nucleoside-diphosphate-sugar epimerase
MEQTTLITGAPGWLGTRFVRLLVNGIADVPGMAAPENHRQIRCLVLRGTPARTLQEISPTVQVFEGDVRDPRSMDDFFRGAENAVVFHLTGMIHPKRIHELYDINVGGIQNVLKGALSAGARRLIAISSNSPAGFNPFPNHLFDESSPDNPYLNYGKSKKQMEDLLQEAFDSRKIDTVILRPCWFYGPGQPPRQTRFFRMIRDGKVPIVGSGESKRSLSYIDNICQALILAEKAEAARGRIYWIADRRPYTMNEIVGTIENLLEQEFGKRVAHRRMRLPGVVSEIAFMLDKMIQGVGLYNQSLHVLSEMNKTIACSIALAQKELGYDPKIDLKEGMRRSIRWCLDHGQPL